MRHGQRNPTWSALLLVAWLVDSKKATTFEHPVIYAHAGKAGGGTVDHCLEARGLLNLVEFCHPKPCLKPDSNITHILVTVRDPVDRFVSAFDWRAFLLCEKYNETRSPAHGKAFTMPAQKCDVGREVERALVHDQYHFNANELALALCEGSRVGADILRHIRHMDSLSSHLGGVGALAFFLKRGVGVYATVLEPGFDFEAQVRSAVDQLAIDASLETNEGSSDSLSTSQSSYNKAGGIDYTHSAKSTRHPPSSLTSEGVACVANYYRADYEVIASLVEVGCHGSMASECQESLKSILRRRQSALN